MKTIILVYMFLFMGTNLLGQKTKLNIVTKDSALKFNNGIHKLRLYCMTGFDDSVSIYLDKKLIQSIYVKSLWNADNGFIPIEVFVNYKSDSNLLEIVKKKSSKTYCTYIVRGYGCAIFYLENDNSVVYTNRLPKSE